MEQELREMSEPPNISISLRVHSDAIPVLLPAGP